MTAPSQDQVEAAIHEVAHPLFDRPLGDVDAVGKVSLTGTTVKAQIRVSVPNPTVHEEFRQRIESHLKPLGVTELTVDFQLQIPTRDIMGEDPLPKVRNIILIMSGKGGVGKSTVAANVALALHRMGARVGLLDADMYGPSVPTMFGIQEHPRSEDGQSIKPLERHGIQLMSIGFLTEDPKAAIVWRGPMLHGALNQFLTDVDWGELDYLLLDLPPGTGDIALTLAQRLKVTGALMVTTPQEVALQDVYKGVSMCQRLQIPLLGVVENMSYFTDPAGARHALFGEGGGQKVADFGETALLGQVPLETAVREGGDGGVPVVRAAPESAAARELTAVAEGLAQKIALTHFAQHGVSAADTPKRLRILR